MKTLFVLALMMAASTSFADVKITSFRYVNSYDIRSTVTELCGAVTPATGKSELVKITVDPGTDNTVYYHANTGKDGNFCLLLSTLTGRATAELE
jgi:hypothetical protein